MSEYVVVAHELVLIFIVDGRQVGEVNLVPEQAADATKTLDELSTLLRAVRDELQVRTELLVLFSEPLEERLRLDDLLHLGAGGLVRELLAVLFLLLADVNGNLL